MEKIEQIEGIKVSGMVKLDIIGVDGKLRDTTGWIENTISNNAFAVISGLVGNVDTQVAFTFLAVGTDATAESATHTTLQAEIEDSGLERAAATVTRVTTTQTNDTLQLFKEWTATGTKAIEECGIFNVVTADTVIMLGRKLTTTKTVNASELLRLTYKVKFA